MIAEYLKNLVLNNTEKDFSFIWAAPRKLHLQSMYKLDQHFKNSRVINCSTFEDLVDNSISKNEILFINWESINKEKNIFFRENEQDFYLEKIANNTSESNRSIILIIDESHYASRSEKSQKLVSIINPKLSILISATPNSNGELVTVHRQNVIKEGMIKKYPVK